LSSTLFVSNLDYKVKWKHLFDAFSMAGKVVTGEMKLDDDGKSRGMAVVQMDNPLEAIQAISMLNNQMMLERKLSVRMDRYDGNEPMRKSESDRRSKGGLPEGLRNVGLGLGANGSVVNIGRLLEEQRQQQQMLSTMTSTMSGMMGGGMPSMGGGMMPPSGMMSGMMGNMSSMMGGGMPSMGTGERGLGEMRGMTGDRMPRDLPTSMSMGASSTPGSMPLSDFNRGSSMGLGSMRPSAGGDFGSSIPDFRPPISMPAMSSAMSSNNGLLGSFGRTSMAPMDRAPTRPSGGSGESRDPECSIFVRNLPFSMNWQDLKDKFRCVGDVRYADVKQKEGKSMGCGIVRFNSKEDAKKAIELFDRTRVEGREIEVRMDRV